MALHQLLQVGAASGNGVVKDLTRRSYNFLKVMAVFGAGTSAGVVTVEEAHDPAYAGTWSSIGTLTWTAASTVKVLAFTGPFMAVRARISTNIVGGTVDVHLVGDDSSMGDG